MGNEVTLNFTPESLIVLNLCLAFIMYSVALHLQWSNLKYVFASPKAVFVGVASQYLVLPAVTVLMVFVFDPSPSVAAGMVLLAACPGGNVSNFFTLIGRGNIELSVTLTTISSLASAFTTPLLFIGLSALTLRGGDGPAIELPFLPTLLTIGWAIVLPALAGMATANRFPAAAARLKKPLQSLSMVVLIGFMVSALYGNFGSFIDHIASVFFLIALHHLLATLGGYGLPWLLKQPKANRVSIALETSIQNTALGLVITFNFFDGNGPMAFVLAWWGVWHLIAGYVFARIVR